MELKQMPQTQEEVYLTLKIDRFNSMVDNLPCVRIKRGRALKPYCHHKFRSEEQRESFINEQKVNVKAWEDRKEEERLKRKNFMPTLKADDILNGSWGYDQTNQEFFIVLEVKGKVVIIQELAHKSVENTQGFMCESILPDLDSERLGEPIKKRILEGDRIKLMDYCYISKWKGNAVYKSWYA